MLDCNEYRIFKYSQATLFTSKIICIDKSKLGRYLGTMNDSFMNELQGTIDFGLGLKRFKTVNKEQVRIFSTVNIGKLLEIAESNEAKDRKLDDILKLFNFNMSTNGSEYIRKAILVSLSYRDYTLDILIQKIANDYGKDMVEIKSAITESIKDRFTSEKSWAISFIRLISGILKKG